MLCIKNTIFTGNVFLPIDLTTILILWINSIFFYLDYCSSTKFFFIFSQWQCSKVIKNEVKL